MYSVIGAIIATAGALAVSGAVCEPDCIQSLSSLITGSQPLQQPQASPQQTPTANPTPSLSIGGSQTAEKSKPSGNSGGTFGPIILSSPKPVPSKQCNQFKETCYQYLQSGSQPAGQAYSDQQCQAKFGYAYHYDYRMNGCVPLGGSQPLQHAQSQTTQNTINYNYQNRQCVARFGDGFYYDPTTIKCLPPSGSWANYSTHVDNNQQCQAQYGQGSYYDSAQNRCRGGSVGTYAPVDPNAECQKQYWYIKGIYYDGKGCVPPSGWANYKVLKYDLFCLGCVNYSIDVSGVKDDIEKSINTGQYFDTQSRPRIHYDDSPDKHHIVAQIWFSIQPTGGNNVHAIIHLENAYIDEKYRGNLNPPMEGDATYRQDDGTIKGTISIGELQKMFDEWRK